MIFLTQAHYLYTPQSCWSGAIPEHVSLVRMTASAHDFLANHTTRNVCRFPHVRSIESLLGGKRWQK